MLGRREFFTAVASGTVAMALPGCSSIKPDAYDAALALQRAPLPANPDIAALVRFATLAANSHNTQPWRFAVSEKQVAIVPDFSRRTPAVDPDDHHLFVSLGCAAENFALAAKASGRSLDVSIRGENDGQILAELTPGREVFDDLFRAIPHRQSTRSEYDGRAVTADDLKKLESAAHLDGVSMLLLSDSVRRDTVRDFVIRGNSAQMDDAAFVRELKHWLRYDAAQALAAGDGLFSRSSGNPALPPWLGSPMFSLVFTKAAENKKYDRQIKSSAGIAVFVGDKEDKEHWVKVGRSFQRFALQATALGIRHAHVNQPIEVPSIRHEFSSWLGIGSVRPDLVLRFGYAPPMPMSLRRPVPTVLAIST